MSDPEIKYSRLPGRGRRTRGLLSVGGVPVSTLWLGPDHLLSVDRIWMNEEFKRFYFQDIQGFAVVINDGRLMWNAIFGCLVLATVLIFGIIASDVGAGRSRTTTLIAGGIITGFWLLLILINGLRGLCCKCTLKTAVHTEVLPSLKRLRNARKMIEMLTPFIEQAQASLVMEEIPANGPEGIVVNSPGFMPVPGIPVSVPPPPTLANIHDSGIFHALFYLVLGITGVLQFVPIRFSENVLALCTLSTFGLGLAAFIRQRNRSVWEPLRVLSIWSFFAIMIAWAVGYFVRIYSTVYNSIINQRVQNTRLHLATTSAFTIYMDIVGAGALLLAICGLVLTLLHHFKGDQAAPDAPQSAEFKG